MAWPRFFCIASPRLFEQIGGLYVWLARSVPGSLPAITALRWLLATSVVFLPAVGMGATLPLLAPWIGSGGSPRRLSLLYALNVFGGSVGALGAAYAIIPNLGLGATLRTSALINVTIGAVAATLGRRQHQSLGLRPPPDTPPAPDRLGAAARSWFAFGSGFSVFAAEVVFVHLLALVIGTSVYAFGLMLSVFLVCLGMGAWIASCRGLDGPWSAPIGSAAAGLAMAVTVPLWDHLPKLFDKMAPYATTWGAREAGRGLVAALALALGATAMGTVFPLVLRDAARLPRPGAEVGRLAAQNTLGSIAGSIVGGFLFLPALGSQKSLLAIAVGYATLALFSFGLSRGVRGWNAGLLGVVTSSALTLLVVVLVPPWNLAQLTSGANVYFDSGPEPDGFEMVREDVHGGVTTVTRTGKLLTLKTNGKFQGNNGYELEAQRAFAHIPCMLAERHERAFVIGLGTGTTVGTLAAYPFRSIEVAEISPAIAYAARTYFSDVNADALNDPRVHVREEDGRNALLVSTDRYDVVGIEISSIWFAGAASLYSREFYQIVAQHLARGGVLQQWAQFHHMQSRELAAVLGTVRAVFPHVALFAHGNQGIIVAGAAPLVMSRSRARGLADRPAVARLLESKNSLAELLDDLLVADEVLDRFVEDMAREAGLETRALLSTDDNVYLEYATPKNNVPGTLSIDDSIVLLARYRAPGMLARHLAP